MSRVLGLDLSLTSTGLAEVDGTTYTTRTLKPPAKLKDYERLEWVRFEVWETAWDYEGGLVVVEGPAFGAKGSAYHQLAGLWWLITHMLRFGNVEFVVVSPGALKKYATGKGTASKDDMMLATARRFPEFAGDNNAADALWLAVMGADHLGHPVVAMPAAHRAALDAVQWPEIREAS